MQIVSTQGNALEAFRMPERLIPGHGGEILLGFQVLCEGDSGGCSMSARYTNFAVSKGCNTHYCH